MFCYAVTASPPSSVSHAARGSFTAVGVTNLVVCRCTRLEVFTISELGVRSVLDEALQGRIAIMELFRPAHQELDLLFLCTERYQYAVVAWDPVKERPITLQNGQIRDRTGRLAENGPLGFVDAINGFAVLHLYQGLLKIIPLEAAISKARLLASGIPVSELASAHAAGVSESYKHKGKGKLNSASSMESYFRESPEPFNIRLEELNVISLVSLTLPTESNTATTLSTKSSMALLYQDAREKRHIKSYCINIQEKELERNPPPLNEEASARPVSVTAHAVIPVGTPFGGVIVLEERDIRYISKGVEIVKRHVTSKEIIIKGWSYIDPDGCRILLGDTSGDLSILFLVAKENRIKEIHFQRLGNVSAPSALTYLDHGYAFVGSHFGDSCLVQLLEEPNEQGDNINVIQVWTNIAPITDFLVFDADNQNSTQSNQLASGQGQIVTCSGAFKDGSLRIVRHGIGITELSHLEITALQRVWTLKIIGNGDDASSLNLIAISTPALTTMLQFVLQQEVDMDKDEMDDNAAMELKQMKLQSLLTDETTLEMGMVSTGDILVQITPTKILGINVITDTIVWEWSPSNAHLVLASLQGNKVICSTGRELLLFAISNDQLRPITTKQFPSDVSALDITTHRDNETEPSYCCVGFWDNTVALLSLPDLESIVSENLGEINAQSITLMHFSGTTHFLVGQGDGVLKTFVFDESIQAFTDRHSIVLGTQPIRLTKFRQSEQTLVLCSSDRPTILHGNSGKLMFSNLNLSQTIDICSLSVPTLPGSVVIATNTKLILGTIDDIQNIHISTHTLDGEMARRVAHHVSSKSLCVLTERVEMHQETGYVRLLDRVTYENRSSDKLHPYESPQSITVMHIGGDNGTISTPSKELIVVGTAYVVPGESDPCKGRILVYDVNDDGRLRVYAQQEVNGAVYCLTSVRGYILAGINSRVNVYEFNDGASTATLASTTLGDTNAPTTTAGTAGSNNAVGPSNGLARVCSNYGHILVLFLATRGDFVLVGDLMKSVSLLLFDADKRTLVQVARDPAPMWNTAVADFDEDHYIASDTGFNIVVVRRNAGAVNEDEKRRLDVVAQFHTGEYINRFRHGSIRPNYHHAAQSIVQARFVYGSVNGTLGIIGTLNESNFQILSTLAIAVARLAPSIGDFDAATYRAFANDRKREDAKGVVDGDMVERYLDLNNTEKSTVVKSVNERYKKRYTVQEMTKMVEELTLLH